RRRDRDESLDLRASHQKLHADPRAKREAGDPAGARLGVDRLRPVERGGGVRKLANAVIERALAAADTAEVEADRGEAPMHERIIELIDDLMIHRAAELWVRVQDDGDRGVFLRSGMVAAFDAAGRSG